MGGVGGLGPIFKNLVFIINVSLEGFFLNFYLSTAKFEGIEPLLSDELPDKLWIVPSIRLCKFNVGVVH